MKFLTKLIAASASLVSSASAYSSGIGSCAAGINSVGGTHLRGDVSTLSDLFSASVSINGATLSPGTTAYFDSGEDLTWTVTSSGAKYKGIFVRVEAESSNEFVHAGIGSGLTNAGLCGSVNGNVIGVGHNSAALKSSNSGTMYFTGTGSVSMDVTLVYENDFFSLYAFSNFPLFIESAPTDAPTPRETTNRPTRTPIEPVPRPVSEPVPTVPPPVPTNSVPAPPVSVPAPTISVPAPTNSVPTPTISLPAPTISVLTPTISVPATTNSTPAPTVSVPVPTNSTAAPNPPSLAEYLSTDEQLFTFVGMIAAAGFNISSNATTIFAPTNDAFEKLDPQFLSMLLQTGWSKHLSDVLSMHISTAAALSSSDLLDGDEIFALNAESLFVSIENSNISFSSPSTNNSALVEPDIAVVEGIIHKVDQVLLPQFVSTDLRNLLGGDRFTIFSEFLTLSGFANVMGSDVIATVFAPTDDAFNGLGDDALEYYRANTDIVSSLLAGHVIADVVLPTSDMMNGPTANKTARGTYLTIAIEELNGAKIYLVNNATISVENVLANNGILHGLSSVLPVPGTEYPPGSLPATPTASPTTSMPRTVPLATPVPPMSNPASAPITSSTSMPAQSTQMSPTEKPRTSLTIAVVGSVVGGMLLMGGVWFFMQKQRRNKNDHDVATSHDSPNVSSSNGSSAMDADGSKKIDVPSVVAAPVANSQIGKKAPPGTAAPIQVFEGDGQRVSYKDQCRNFVDSKLASSTGQDGEPAPPSIIPLAVAVAMETLSTSRHSDSSDHYSV